ncbi:MAG: hypothetical protein R3E79_46785 [Caldilineaceae bacterium]
MPPPSAPVLLLLMVTARRSMFAVAVPWGADAKVDDAAATPAVVAAQRTGAVATDRGVAR